MAPRWQSPAIFLQQSISALVIWRFGKQASAGATVHRTTKLITRRGRIFAIPECYIPNRGVCNVAGQLGNKRSVSNPAKTP